MFGWWRRKNDGFEWREYVRTTVLVRREERARKIDEIRQAAASGAKAAGHQGVSAGRHGIRAAASAASNAARWLWQSILTATRGAGSGFMWLGARAARWLGALPDTVARLRMPTRISANAKIATMFGTLGLLAAISATLQYRQSGLDWSTVLAGLVALILVGLALAPWLRRMAAATADLRRVQLPPALSYRPSMRWVAIAALAVISTATGVWAWRSGTVDTASTSIMAALPNLPMIGIGASLPDIRGRAIAVTGDTLRIAQTHVVLTGIEAPEISQVCRDRRNRAWRCGYRARRHLQRLIRRRDIECHDVSPLRPGFVRATCSVKGEDPAGEMVKQGYAFAASGIFNRYADMESEAREARRGVWQGASQRPSEFRASKWATASKSAPDGCPIKGRIVRRAKVYVLPWALDYRQVRVREQLGERWFCSEDEAQSAGFEPSSTG